ncbi:phage tail assembly protein T [Escherichia coli]
MMFSAGYALFRADVHHAGLFSNPDMHALDFSLLNRREADEEPEDDVLMQKRQGLRRRPLWPGRE